MDSTLGDLTAASGVFFVLLLLFVMWIAKRNDFFRLPPHDPAVPVTLKQTVGAFLTYLIFSVILVPILLVAFAYGETGSIKGIKTLSSLSKSWIQILGLSGLFLLLILYCLRIDPTSRQYIFWGGKPQSTTRLLKSSGMGFVGWVVSYPFVLVATVISSAIAKWLWGESELEQVAVKQLKLSMNSTPLLIAMVVVIVVLVPFMEELLFRGFLQNLLKRYLGRAWAIALTALIFAGFHYSSSQGVGNFQLIFSLVILAAFLGFIYEREQTLWAPTALHMTFNALNAIGIIFAH